MQNQNGSTSVLLAVVMTILFLAAAGFSGWAFMGYQDYKNNSDKKSAAAVAVAEEAQETALRKQFAEEEKNPNKSYTSTAVQGSITFKYPKTWSAYVDSTSSTPLNGYFHPQVLPGLQSGAAYALRLELVNTPYADIVKREKDKVRQNKVRAVAYVPPKMKKVSNVQTGTRFDGVVGAVSSVNEKKGAMVVIAVRDKTLKIYTESPTFLADFNKIVLPSLTFAP